MNVNNTSSALNFWHDSELGGPSFMSARYHKAHNFERHVHDELVITVTEQGVGHAKARNVADALGSSAIWVSGLGEYHYGSVSDQQQWSYRAIYLNQQALQAVSSVFRNGTDGDPLIPHGVYVDPQLSTMLLTFHKQMELRVPLLEKQALWWSTMGLFFGRYGQQSLSIASSDKETSKMEMIREYIAMNFRENISTEKLAAITGLSRFYLIRSFKRKYGLPPHAYANQLKLLAAKQQLTEGITPAAVASDVGFYDQSHFNRLFKKAYGITPCTYAEAFK